MSTTIPIQDLDISTSPPGGRRVHAVVTLLWPYSSSTRQCALLLSERDFRLRARGGQIRVKFSGPAARAVAEGRLGIGDEVVLELGSGEWVTDEGGVPVRVPGKSVGELQFGRGVNLTVKRRGVDDVKVSVADDAVDEAEEEEEQALAQIQATPRQKANFRSSFGGSPGSAAIYSSPAYMRKAAKYSYLDGISRLFEDEWDNQDLPRKKARTSIGDVKSWKMVDRTPSPERLSSEVAVPEEDQDMAEVDSLKETGEETTALVAVEAINSQTSQPGSLAKPSQDSTSLPSAGLTGTLPRLQLPSASPTPQSSQVEIAAAQTIDPVTPRLVPLSSTALPSTTPQISPLATKAAFGRNVDAGLSQSGHGTSQVAEMPESHAEAELATGSSSKPITKASLEQGRPPVTGNKSTAAAIASITEKESVSLEGDETDDAPRPWKSSDLAKEEPFFDNEADDVLSAHEKDGEMMYEEDAEDVFDADGLDGEEPSDDETISNPRMHSSPHDDQDMEESMVEEDSEVENEAPTQSEVQKDAAAQPTESTPKREVYQQPGFAPASTLLRGEDISATMANSSIVAGQPTATTPLKKPTFGVDGVIPSTELATPAARTVETPNRTPQSVRDKVMKRTFSSLFGIKGSPSPEKEDANMADNESDGEANLAQNFGQPVNESGTSKVDDSTNHMGWYMGLDGQNDVEETHALTAAPPVSALADQASFLYDRKTPEVNDALSTAARELPEQHEQAVGALPRDQTPTGSPPAELINLDFDSDPEIGEAKIEKTVAEQVSERHENSPPSLASTVDERGEEGSGDATLQEDLVDPGVPEPTLMDAKSDDISAQEGLVDVAAPEPILVDSEQASSERDITEQQESKEEFLKEEAPAENDNDSDVSLRQTSQAPDSTNERLDTIIPDSAERITVSRQKTPSPEPEVPESISLEPEQITQALPEQPHDSVADVDESAHEPDQQVNVDEAVSEVPDSMQPPLPQQEPELRSASVTPKNVADLHDDSQTNMTMVGDVDMLDAQEQEREPGSPRSSFDSQVVQDSISTQQREPGSSLVIFESQMVQDKIGAQQQELEPSLASFEPQVVQNSVHAQQQERESPLASFESQVVQSSIAQTFGVNEHSSRPASRDTVEDFSPVQLGSFSQRISGIVDETQAMERQGELEVNDHVMSEQIEPEESGVSETNLSVDAMESLTRQDVNTPSRVTNHGAVEDLQSSPSSFGEFSPVKIDQNTHAQVLTPKATLAEEEDEEEEKQEDGSVADETLIEQQLASELHEDPAATDPRPLENQPSVKGVERQPLLNDADESVSGQNEQPTRSYESAKGLPAYPTLPITPSATQLQPLAVEPEAPLSHASVGRADAQSTPMKTQLEADTQHSTELDFSKATETSTMSQPQQTAQELSEIPPPEQPAPPKTPGRKSLRSRLSNVPDVISAWFSPKRSSIAAQEAAKTDEIETAAASTADAAQNGSARKKHVGGIATAHAYFTKLASLEKRLNPTGDQTGAVDILAIVADSTKEPGRAERGPRDYYTILKIMDPSIPTTSPVRVEVFRPWKAVLPAADVGDVVLLRGFVVKSRKRQPYLLSTDSSAWCVWRFAEYNDNEGRVADPEAEKSVRARRMSHIDVREEVKGPPVEYGFAEKEEARKLRDWWIEVHGDSKGGASDEAAGKAHLEETGAVEA